MKKLKYSDYKVFKYKASCIRREIERVLGPSWTITSQKFKVESICCSASFVAIWRVHTQGEKYTYDISYDGDRVILGLIGNRYLRTNLRFLRGIEIFQEGLHGYYRL